MLFEADLHRAPMGVRWEESVFAVFDDLEMQAEGLYLDDRVGEVASLADAAYAEVSLAARLHAARGRSLRVLVVDGADVRGTLARSGAGWLALDAGSSDWLVPLSAVGMIEGLPTTSTPEQLWPLTARLSISSVLRRIAEARRPCTIRLREGRQLDAVIERVGADFISVRAGSTDAVVPLSGLAAVQERR